MKKTAFIGGILIDGAGNRPVADCTVLVEGKMISYAGPRQHVGGDFEHIDITGKSIMPGLIDTHLHFSGNLSDNDSDWVLEDPVQKAVVAAQQARRRRPP